MPAGKLQVCPGVIKLKKERPPDKHRADAATSTTEVPWDLHLWLNVASRQGTCVLVLPTRAMKQCGRDPVYFSHLKKDLQAGLGKSFKVVAIFLQVSRYMVDDGFQSLWSRERKGVWSHQAGTAPCRITGSKSIAELKIQGSLYLRGSCQSLLKVQPFLRPHLHVTKQQSSTEIIG